jgi:hypothetical protein
MPSVNELQQRAIEYAKSGDFGAQALATNLELARMAPTNEGAWTRLSRCYLEGGQLDEATGALDAVLQLNPQNSIAQSLQIEVRKRRMARSPVLAPPKVRSVRKSPSEKTREKSSAKTSALGGFARGDFTMLGQLDPSAALESIGPRIEAVLMVLNDRPFAGKAVETRNRAGQSGARLFRRNTIRALPGALRACHQGGRWEPQLHVAFQSATVWGRDAICAGIGFNLAAGAGDREGQDGDEAGQERALAHFAAFQQLVSGAWRTFLTDWMAVNGGFIQYAGEPPATSLMPKDALSWLINCQQPADVGWVFYGRWLFADRSQDAEIIADGRRLTTWLDVSFSDLLPLWTSLYRA